MRDLPFELVDLDNGTYELTYIAEEGEVAISIKLMDENNKQQPIRGPPGGPALGDLLSAGQRGQLHTCPKSGSGAARMSEEPVGLRPVSSRPEVRRHHGNWCQCR